MKTRAAAALAKAQRVEETGSYLTEQSAEVLNIIANFLADPLWTCRLGRLASTCKTLKEATKDALVELRPKHDAAVALMRLVRHDNNSIGARDTGLRASNMPGRDMPTLVNILKSEVFVKLEHLNLKDNSIGDEGVITFATAAAGGGLPQIKKLDLGDNDIGVAGVQALASAFAEGAFCELTSLDLESNKFGDAGAAALSKALEKGALPSLESLALINTEIGDEGVQHY